MDGLVNYLISIKVLKTPEIIEAFRNIDRAGFVLPEYKNIAYVDLPLPIGFGQTISEPKTVAFMLELLNPKKGQKILDIGSGSGWTTALLSYIVGKKGIIIGTELVPELVSFGKQNLKICSIQNAEIIQAGGKIGYKKGAPYDRILVSASAEEFPDQLLDQLANGGILVIPVRESIWKICKNNEGKISKKEYPGFVFVPLIE